MGMKTINSQKGNSSLSVILSFVFLFLGFVAGIFFISKFNFKPPVEVEPTEQPGVIAPLVERPQVIPENTCDVCDLLPVVVYAPGGLFTPAEKEEVEDKMANPFNDFNLENDTQYLTIHVEKFDPLPAHGYKYNVTAISKTGVNTGFLYGQSTPLEWWLPECMDSCNLSAEFVAKYPEIAAQVE